MSNVLRFTCKSILTLIILMIVTSGMRPYTTSAQVDAKKENTGFTGPPQEPSGVPANPIALSTNLIQDPGFEASYRSNQFWQQLPFDTICNAGDPVCFDTGAGYNSAFSWA